MTKKSAFQTWIEFIAFRSVMWVLRILPNKVSIGLGFRFVQIAFRMADGRLPSGIRSLEIAFPDMDPKERRRIFRRSIESLGRTLSVTARSDRISADELRSFVKFDFDSDEFAAYKRAKSEGRGVILPTAHIGNWEILLSAFAIECEPIYFVARTMDNPLIEMLVAEKRSKNGNRQITKTATKRKLLQVLNSGGSVGVLPDVNAHLKDGVFVPFFGVPACTVSGVGRLAIHTDALILPMFAIWVEEESRYVVHNGRPIEPSKTGDRERDVVETTAAYTLEIERIIRRFPEQWIWIHKRWRTRPPGEPELY